MSIEILNLLIALLVVVVAVLITILFRLRVKLGYESIIYDIYNNIECGIVILDLDKKILEINHRISKIFGMTYRDIEGSSFEGILDKQKNEIFFEKLEKSLILDKLQKSVVSSFEEQVVTKYGINLQIECRIVPHIAKSKLLSIILVLRDISDRETLKQTNKYLEEKLQSNEEKHPLINFTALVSPDMTLNYLQIGKKIVTLIGRSYDEILNNPNLLLPMDRDVANKYIESIKVACQNLSPFNFTAKYLHSDGGEKVFNVHALPYNEDNQLYLKGFFNDITESYNQNEIIKEQKHFLSSVVENSPIAIFAKTYPEGKYVVINGKAMEFYGRRQSEVINKMDSELFEESNTFYNNLSYLEQECIDSLQPVSGYSFEYDTDLERKQIYLECLPVIVDNSLKQIIGIIHDQTENINTVNAYQERQNKLTAIVENNMVGVVMVDQDYSIVYANKAMTKMVGYTQSELQRLKINDLTHPHEYDGNKQSLDKLWTGTVESLNLEKTYVRKDGSHFVAEIFVSPVKDIKGKITSSVALIININQRKEAEKMLIQRDRILEAVSFASRHFLNEDNFEIEIKHVFKAISQSTKADYVGIYKFEGNDTDKVGQVQNFVWYNDTIVETDSYKELYFHDSNISIFEQLEQGKYVYLTDSHKSSLNFLLLENKEKTTFLSPIIVDKALWGLIKIGKIQEEIFWSHAELDALQSAANVLGAAINRKNINTQLKNLNIELETRIAKRTSLLEEEIKERKQVESSLRISQKKLEKMIAIAPIGIARLSNKSMIQEVNPEFLSIFEYPENELEGLSFYNLYPEKQRPIYKRLHEQFVEKGIENSGERSFVSKSGKNITAYINLMKTRNEKELIETYIFIYDVTEHKRVEINAKKLKLGIEKSFDAFAITDLFGDVEYVNDAFERITGYKSEEMLRKNMNVLKSGLQTPDFYKSMWDDILSGKNWKGTLINQNKNGKFYYEEMTIVPVFNDLNIITNFVAIKRDITSVKKSQEEILKSETKYRQIFENATEGIIMLNYEYIMFANPAFEELTGFTNFQANNRKFIDMIFEADKETVFKLTHTKDKNLVQQKHDVRLIDVNNKIKWVNINSNKVNWDNKIMVLLFISDITARKHAEQALEEERSYLADRVIERTEELSALNAELSKAVRAKDEFLANMSHELRTPLNAILGLSEILQKQLFNSINDKQQKSFRTINESGQHLLSLINDILDLSKIEAGKLNIVQENVLVEPIAVSAIRFVAEAANKKDLKISFDFSESSLMVWADTRRLRQILINLLSNAVKFTPAGKEVGLNITKSISTDSVIFEVWDKGIGITETDMKSLFRPFVQLDSALSREYEGSGLGLSLVAKLVELHGGSIEMESAVGEGSSFKVALPAISPDFSEYDEQTEYDISFMKDRTMIVVTENQEDYMHINNLLNKWTSNIFLFDNDGNGINEVLEILPDLIIIDTSIKHRSAWEIMAILKHDSRTKDIKIIMASMGQELGKASAVGADAFIGKPISSKKIERALCETYQVCNPVLDVSEVEKQYTILLAEDNEANIETIEAFLTMNKYKIIIARNGQEAIEWVHEHRPDLILMDIQMPKMNGFEAIDILKSTDEFSDIPIIALTALAMPGDRKRILDAGANDYLSKPVSMKILINRIQTFLKSSL